MRILRRSMRFFFWHFYHSFAWTYEFVAGLVSLGRWNQWIDTVLPYIQGARVLEIGHGPGHLQFVLAQHHERLIIGLDESPQMGRLAQKRISKAGISTSKLTRGLAQFLPFPSCTFDMVVSTFPAEYIFEVESMSQVYRVLRPEGRFVLLPAAWIVGHKALELSAAWLFRVTGQAPVVPLAILSDRIRHPLEEVGFKPHFKTIEVSTSLVLLVVASK